MPFARQPDQRCSEQSVAAAIAAHGFFAPDRPVSLARAPGRLDVMGGNVDYTGGMVLQGLLHEAVWAASQPSSDDMVRVLNPGAAAFGWQTSFELTLDDLRAATIRELCPSHSGAFWGRYVLGSIHFLQRFFPHPDRRGLDLFLDSDLPPNKGVSSSAALIIATLKACAAAWDVELTGVALATAGQWVENIIAGAACGIMDQAAIALGRKDHLLPLLCQPCLPFAPVALPPGVRIWGIDSMAPRATTSAAYEAARAAAFMGYRMICRRDGLDVFPVEAEAIPRWSDARWNGYLSNLATPEFRFRYERWLPDSITGREFLSQYGEHVDPFTSIDPARDYPVRAAVRYAVEENHRVRLISALFQAAASSSSGAGLELAGELFCQSHLAYAECGLSSEACDELVQRARAAGLPGAKMTGGGGGGVVAILGREHDRNIVRSIAEDYAKSRDALPHIFEGSSHGADAFGLRTLQPADLLSVRR